MPFYNGLQIEPGHTILGGTGNYLGPAAHGATTTLALSGVGVVNRLYQIPLVVYRPLTITRLAIEAAPGAASNNARLGIYNSLATTGLPGALLADGGVVSLASTAVVESAAISVNLIPGLYWMACVFDNTTATVRAITNSSGPRIGYNPSTPTQVANGVYRAYTYGAMPADESAESYTFGYNLTFPIMWVRQ